MKLEYKWKKRMVRLPYFIDTGEDIDYWLWIYIRNITESVCDICFLKNPKDDYLIGESNKNMRLIEKLLLDDKKKFVAVIGYLVEFIDELFSDLLEYEMYEAAARMKKFNDNFYVPK